MPDWSDIGKNVFGGVHTAGKILASAFGGAPLVAQVERLEQPILPEWAGGAPPPGSVLVTGPQAFVIVRQSGAVDGSTTARSVLVTGGSRIAGDGRFDFGYDGVARLDVVAKDGRKASGTDVKAILFRGGSESSPTVVKGDTMVTEYGGKYVENEPGESFEVARNIYIHGTDICGALSGPQASRANFVIRKTARGRTFTSLATTPRKGDIRASVANARDVGRRAVQVANRINSTLSRLPTTVRGATPQRQARRQVTIVEMRKLAGQLAAAGKKLIDKGEKLDAGAKKADARLKAGTMALAAKQFRGMGARAGRVLAPGVLAPGAVRQATVTRAAPAAAVRAAQRASVVGDYEIGAYEVLGDAWEVLGEELWGDYEVLDAELSALHYEVLGDAEADAAQAAAEAEAYAAFGPRPGESGPTAPSTGEPAGASSYASAPVGAPVTGPESNYGMGPPPTEAPPPAPGTFTPGTPPETDQNIYDSTKMPLAGIVYYSGEKGLPRDGMGSWNRYYGDRGTAEGGSGFYWDGESWRQRDKTGPAAYHDSDPLSAANIDWMIKLSAGDPATLAAWPYTPYGPLVGSPNGWTKGLRFDVSNRSWFWFLDQAPKWATVVQDLERLHQAQVDYETALTANKTAYLEQVAQDKLDAQQSRNLARQQALDDANTARQQQELETRAAQLEQQMAEQQQRYEGQMADLDVREQSAMMSYFEQNPEEMFAAVEEGGGEGGEGGVDWGSAEDTEENWQAAQEMFSEE